MKKKLDTDIKGQLSRIAVQLRELAKVVSADSDPKHDYKLWETFADLELAATLLKLEVKKENPAHEIPRPKSPLLPQESLTRSSELVESSVLKLSKGQASRALEEVREARDTLRELLVRVRRR